MISTREDLVWHNIGTSFNEPLTISEAIKQADADFNVGLQPLVALSPEMVKKVQAGIPLTSDEINNMTIHGRKATMRTDHNHTLGIVSDTYGIVQNQDAFNFVNLLATGKKEEDPIIECAGAIGYGEKVFVTAKFPEPIRLAGNNNDPVDMYIVFSTSHDGKGAVNVMITPVRVVCNNMLNLAFKQNSGRLSLRHTRYIGERLDLMNKENAKMAYQTLNLYNTYKTYFEESLNDLANKKLTDAQIKDVIAKITLPDEAFKIYKEKGNVEHEDISTRARNQFYSIMNSLDYGVGQEVGEKGTGLWLINGITTHYQNTEDWKGKDEKKYNSLTEGMVQSRLQTAYDYLRAA